MRDDLSPHLIPGRLAAPVLLSVAHSGRVYPPELTRLARVDPEHLRRLEDPLVDRLIWRAVADGVGAVVASAPRAYVDCNRDESDIDHHVVEGAAFAAPDRARHGLGIVPTRLGALGRLWSRPLSVNELDERLSLAHRPYHRMIEQQLAAMVAHYGECVLIDCHSMPPGAGGSCDVVIGDRHGTSASAEITAGALSLALEAGFSATTNEPYAGGYIVERHGAPWRGIHAIQVEIDRSLYLDAATRAPGAEFDRVAHFLRDLAAGLSSMLSPSERQAAE